MLRCSTIVIALVLGCRATPTAEGGVAPDARDAIERTASGLSMRVLEPGKGDKRPRPYDRVEVRLSRLDAAQERDARSHARGGAVTAFDVRGVMPGLSEGLQQMTAGEARRFWIPDRLAYPGRPGYPRAPVIYDVELVAIIEGRAPLPSPAEAGKPSPEATRTASGLSYRRLRRGAGGKRPRAWDRVRINFAGWTRDGAMFDAARRRDRPATFDLDDMMPGLREALQLMSVGDQMRIWIPQALAYRGRVGRPEGPLLLDVELRAIERRPEPPRPTLDVTGPPERAKKTASGLAYVMLQRGEGRRRPDARSRVEVSYSAWTADGELFDSSVVRGKPARLPMSKLIPGWREGLQLMSEGDRAALWIPERLAYGGAPGAPKGMLAFEVELLKVRDGRAAPE